MTSQRDGDRSAVAGLRIAVVNWRDPWHPQAGGAERYAWEISQGLSRRGAEVWYVTARAPGQARREVRHGVSLFRMGGRFTVYPLVLLFLLWRRGAVDAVIDCQNGIPFFTPWVLPRRVTVLCVMHHVHDAQFGVYFPPWAAAFGRFLEGPVARWSYRRHECVAVSASTAQAMRRRLGWTGPIHVVHNGLDRQAFEGSESASGTGTRERSVVMVGRLVPHKRVHRVLDVASRLRASGVTIDVVGRGPAAEDLADGIVANGLQGIVRLRGFLCESDKRGLLAGACLHLNTSQGEGWGLCVLEAAAQGVPTVAYDVDGLRDAVRDGETGWLVREGERIEDVVERALKELATPARRAEIRSACLAWARHFDWDASAESIASLIGDGLEKSSGSRHRGAVFDPTRAR